MSTRKIPLKRQVIKGLLIALLPGALLASSTTESFTIPKETTNYLKTFRLTAIGGMLNKGFDHENEGSNLELVVDARVKSVRHLDEE